MRAHPAGPMHAGLTPAPESAGPRPESAAALDELAETLAGERAETMSAVGELLAPPPPEGSDALAAVRRHLNAVRYVDRTLETIRDLRLEQASSSR